jgi:hypothetical protein
MPVSLPIPSGLPRHASNALMVSLMVASLALLGGCSHLQALWPWHKAPPASEPTVQELVVEAGEGKTAPTLEQTWNRNALRVVLVDVSGDGEFRLRPAHGHDWPIRLEFAVRPGSIGHLEVRGEQRVTIIVPATGSVAILRVPQGIYAPATSELTLRYGT